MVLAAPTREPIPQPPGLTATLRDYQRHGLTWLADLTSLGLGACLADDMGLGKTVTLIALHLHRGGGPTLVVCPASLLGNWEAEIARFAPGVPVRRHHGSRRDLDDVEGFVLTTYGTMRVDHAALAEVAVGPRGRRRGPARQERPVLHRPGAADDPRPGPGRAHRHARWRTT